ncbi:MAG: hypothetical protein GF368_03765 [Candidatus Aenigmarchaeota archaeon]|nr:hypothetical protein [Candidatus Aenigmarchaeota archaeon]
MICPKCKKEMSLLGSEEVDWEENKVKTYGCLNCSKEISTVFVPEGKDYLYWDEGKGDGLWKIPLRGKEWDFKNKELV